MPCLGVRLVALIGAVLLAAAGAEAREPHWPATLSLGTASAGGTYFVYGEGLARILTRELKTHGLGQTDRGPRRKHQTHRKRRDRSRLCDAGPRATSLERRRRLDRGQTLAANAGALSHVRHAVPPIPGPARAGRRLALRPGGKAGRHRSGRRHDRHLHARVLQGLGDRCPLAGGELGRACLAGCGRLARCPCRGRGRALSRLCQSREETQGSLPTADVLANRHPALGYA